MKINSKEDWLEMVEKLQASGLTKSEFCRRNQIGTGHFYQLAKRYGDGKIPQASLDSQKTNSKVKPSAFIEIDLAEPPRDLSNWPAKFLKIVTSYGATLEVPL